MISHCFSCYSSHSEAKCMNRLFTMMSIHSYFFMSKILDIIYSDSMCTYLPWVRKYLSPFFQYQAAEGTFCIDHLPDYHLTMRMMKKRSLKFITFWWTSISVTFKISSLEITAVLTDVNVFLPSNVGNLGSLLWHDCKILSYI